MGTQDTGSRKTGTATGAFAILGLAGLAWMQQIASGLLCVVGIPLGMALETLPTIVLTAWHIFQPCALGHLRVLEGLLQVSAPWQFVLMLTGA